MKRFISFFFLSSVFLFFSCSILPACADEIIPPQKATITLTNPLGTTDNFSTLLESVVNQLIKFGSVIAVAMTIYGALQMITAGGKPENFKKGKQTILYTVIGYAIILIGWGITSIITSALTL